MTYRGDILQAAWLTASKKSDPAYVHPIRSQTLGMMPFGNTFNASLSVQFASDVMTLGMTADLLRGVW